MTKPTVLPKFIGADMELGNFLHGGPEGADSGRLASRMILRHIEGVPGTAYGGYQEYNPQDIGRKWLTNGSCCYIDLDHIEMCLPEVTSAWDFCAAFHAQLRIVRAAQTKAAATLAAGVSLHVLACNSDGQGSSWGGHLNFSISKASFASIFHRRLDHLLWLASYQASSIVTHGQGKVGSENRAPQVDFQISQRADFLETIVGVQTTFDRPIINSRNETLTGIDNEFARFHHIACDLNLCHVANVLKVGVLQILLCMVECDADQIAPDAILKNPVQTVGAYSRDCELQATQQTLTGLNLGAVDVQMRFLEAAKSFVGTGACDVAVPKAWEILALWEDTLHLLRDRDWETLSRRLDWVLKRQLLQDIISENPGLHWQSPAIKRLDLLYGSLDPEEGLYWSLEAAGCVDQLVSERQILRFTSEPPSGTRAFTRGHLLRTFGADRVQDVDWDRITIRTRPERGSYSYSRTVHLDSPAEFTRAHTGKLFRFLRDGKLTADQILNAVAAPVAPPPLVRYLPVPGQTGYPTSHKTSKSVWPSRFSNWR